MEDDFSNDTGAAADAAAGVVGGGDLYDPVAEVDALFAPLDDMGSVAEAAGMMAVFAAEQLRRVDRLRRNALADTGRYGGGVVQVVERSVRLEVAAVLRVTEHAAGMLLAHAEALTTRYPAALESLGRARITEQHTHVLATLLDAATPEVRDRLTERAVALAEELPVGSFRRKLRSMVEVEESATLTQRHQDALRERRVVVEPAHDGMAWLHALIPAVEAHAIHSRLTAMGKVIAAEPDDERSLDQVRADVLCDLLIDGNTPSHPREAHGIRATVVVTVPALTLLTETDTHRHAQGLPPATVEGIGPIPLTTAKELCGGEEKWMRVLTHPETGMILSVGRTQYRPPPALRRLTKWRADRCMAPGCGIPASRCQIDHTIAWEHGGPTALHNHAPLCIGHHTIKHHGNWTVKQPPDTGGALLWTSPTGRQYLVRPERPTPAFRPSTPSEHADAPF